jgi:hypothetical protein
MYCKAGSWTLRVDLFYEEQIASPAAVELVVYDLGVPILKKHIFKILMISVKLQCSRRRRKRKKLWSLKRR